MDKKNYEEEYEEVDTEDINLQYYSEAKSLNTSSETGKTDYDFEIRQKIEPKIVLVECPNKNI